MQANLNNFDINLILARFARYTMCGAHTTTASRLCVALGSTYEGENIENFENKKCSQFLYYHGDVIIR